MKQKSKTTKIYFWMLPWLREEVVSGILRVERASVGAVSLSLSLSLYMYNYMYICLSLSLSIYIYIDR